MFKAIAALDYRTLRVLLTATMVTGALLMLSFAGDATSGKSEDNLLALSWQPAFCELRPGKSECRQLNAGHLPSAARQLSLHGLWPQPRGKDYCGVSDADRNIDKKGDWSSLPEPAIDAETLGRLQAAMPGMESHLHRHEWIKHGTCYQTSGGNDAADVYYDDSLYVTAAINRSVVVSFLTARIGDRVDTHDVRDRFDEAFGPGAGERVAFVCKQDGSRTLLQEMRIGLRGTVSPDRAVGDLIRAAPTVPIGCRSGIVDPIGLQ